MLEGKREWGVCSGPHFNPGRENPTHTEVKLTASPTMCSAVPVLPGRKGSPVKYSSEKQSRSRLQSRTSYSLRRTDSTVSLQEGALECTISQTRWPPEPFSHTMGFSGPMFVEHTLENTELDVNNPVSKLSI